MELIKVERNKKNTVQKASDERKRVDFLYGIAVPAYPFTFETLAQDIEDMCITSAETFLNVADAVDYTISETQKHFQEAIAEQYPNISVTMAKGIEEDLMLKYGSGVCGAELFSQMSREAQQKFYSGRGFGRLFVFYRTQQLKAGHAVLAELMLNETIFAVCQGFSLTKDGRIFLLDSTNLESCKCCDESCMEITQEVFRLLKDYNIISQDTRSLGEWLGTFGADVEKGAQILGNSLAGVLFGYSNNDAIQINIVRTATESILAKGKKETGIAPAGFALAQVMTQGNTVL